jgi:DNA-binding GntR family transcriptional regulator
VREIHHLTLHERVYNEIRRDLMAGQFAPGQKVSSRKLAALLRTSDMPVRTALSRLIAEGGLLRRANNTISVPSCSRRSFTEVMDLRSILEQHATRLACGYLTEHDFRRLDSYAAELDEAVRSGDTNRYLECNQNLKFTIYNRCGSETLLGILGILWLKVGPFLRHLSLALKNVEATNFHREAIAALRRGDADAAGAAIARDIIGGRDLLLASATFDTNDAPQK